MIRLYGFSLSLNTERVALALAHKGVETQVVQVDYEDRSVVRSVNGQDLVPVIEEDGFVLSDSTAILRYLEERHPEHPLFPAGRARREEVDVFLDWFNEVWKRPPNRIFLEEQKEAPDQGRIEGWGTGMTRSLGRFEALLQGREYLMGDEFSAADCAAWPFLRYAVWRTHDDPYRFHHILMEHMEAGPDRHPRLIAWIHRIAERPQISLKA